MSDLLNFDDDFDVFADTKHGDAKEANKELDALFEVNAGHVTNDSLDDILKPAVNDDIFAPKPKLKKKKSFRNSFRKKADLFSADNYDPFSPSSSKSDIDSLVPLQEESAASKNSSTSCNEDNSLDFLLDSQPLGMTLSSEDLLSLDPLSSPVTRPDDKQSHKNKADAGSDVSKPSEDLFGDGPEVVKVSDEVDELDDIFASSNSKTELQPESNLVDDIFAATNSEDTKGQNLDDAEDIFAVTNDTTQTEASKAPTCDDLFGNDEGDIFAAPKDTKQTEDSKTATFDELFGPEEGDMAPIDTNKSDDSDLFGPDEGDMAPTNIDKSDESDLFGLDGEGHIAPTNIKKSNESDLFGLDDEEKAVSNGLDTSKKDEVDDLFGEIDEPLTTSGTHQSDEDDDLFGHTEEPLALKGTIKDDDIDDLFNLNDDGAAEVEADLDDTDTKPSMVKKSFMGSVDSLDALLDDQPEGMVPSNDDLMSLATPSVLDNASTEKVTTEDSQLFGDGMTTPSETNTGTVEKVAIKDDEIYGNDLAARPVTDKASTDNVTIDDTKLFDDDIAVPSVSDIASAENVMTEDTKPPVEALVTPSDEKPSLTDNKTPAEQVTLDDSKSFDNDKYAFGNENVLQKIQQRNQSIETSKISINTPAEYIIIKQAESMASLGNKSESKRRSRLDSLDLLLDEQPEGTVPDSDDLQSLVTKPSMIGDSISMTLSPENTSKVSETLKDDGELSVKDDNKSVYVVGPNIEEDDQAMRKPHGRPRHESVDSLDILLDNQPEGIVPDNQKRRPDKMEIRSPLDRLDILLDIQGPDKDSTQPDILELRPESLDNKRDIQTQQIINKDRFHKGTSEPKSCLERLDSLDILLDNQPLDQEASQPDILETKSRLDSLDILLESQPMDEESSGTDNRNSEITNKKTRLDSLDLLLDNQPVEALPDTDSLQSLMIPSKAKDEGSEKKYVTDNTNRPKSRLDSLDILLESQPLDKESSGTDNRNSEMTNKKTRLDSLDLLLDNQPVEALPDTDSLQSLMIPSKAKDEGSEKKYVTDNTNRPKSRLDSLDILLESQPLDKESSGTDNRNSEMTNKKTRLDSLDLLLDNQPVEALPDTDSLQSLMIPSKAENEESDKDHVTDNTNSPSKIDKFDKVQNDNYNDTRCDVYDHAPDRSRNRIDDGTRWNDCSDAPDSSRKTPNQAELDAMSSLDVLLHRQPKGTISVNDNSTLTKPSRSVDLMSSPVPKDSPTENVDPVEEGFEVLDNDVPNIERGQDRQAIDPEVKATPVKGKQGKLKKRAMERSFEDLLNGLSDESEPELDEMILSDDNDNTNLEKHPDKQSILVSPEQGKAKQMPVKNVDSFSTPSRFASTNDDMNVLTSTPNTDTTKSLITPPVEVKLYTPDDDENDFKSWEMVDQVEEKEDNIQDDEDIDDVVMRNRNQSNSSTDDRDIDLSAIEDTNHLDVDINKQRSALGKKGSMALRRKQSRKSRRSVMATGEDAIFQDSTAPSSTDMMNGDDDLHNDKDSENFDMSPPAKKPSPSMMVPLPGMMSGRPPPQRLSASAEDEDVPKPAKRISKPPPGAFKLPDVMPRLSSKPTPEILQKDANSSSHTFEKPALKSAKPSTTKDADKETEAVFNTPALRSVQGRDRERTSGSEERDVLFEKPALRSTPKPRELTPETKMETETGIFSKPALRETPKKPLIDRKEPVDMPTEPIGTRNLRSTNKPGIGQKPSSEKHTFDKPKLRSTGRKESQDKTIEQDNDDNSKTYEKPALRSTKQNDNGPSADNSDSVSYKFDKPALRNTGLRNLDSKKDTGNVGQFDKPSLRKTPTPDREFKPPSEPKGMFDKPSLRKTENSSSVPEMNGKSDYKTSFPETRLRKTASPQKEIVSEKPSWLKDAADKQSKVLDVLQTKENTNNGSKKELPSWLDKTPVLKSSRGQPLQDTSNGQSESVEERKTAITPRSREPSFGSENDTEKRRTSSSEFKTPQNNYVPSWMRQGRSPSTGSVGFISPANSTPSSDEIPQWKKELAQRRSSRKEQSPILDTPKREGSTEPEWKKNIQLRKTRPSDTPARDKQTVEPEWKKAAEEKRARLRNSTVEN